MRRFVHVAVLVLAVGALAGSAALWYAARDPLPTEIRVAAGQPDGLYHTFAKHFAQRLQDRTGRPVRVLATAGSEENGELLRTGGADLALIQTEALTQDGLAGVAPLFPEPLHFVARKGKGIRTPADLVGRRVALGLNGSSIRHNALTVLAHYHVPPAGVRDAAEHFGTMAADPDVDAAIVSTGWMNPILEKLLQRPDVELIDLPEAEALALRRPWLTATTVPAGLYPGPAAVPPRPVRTVAATALLAAPAGASDRLVREALGALYESDVRAAFPAVLTAKAAKEYDAPGLHPSVAAYHDPAAGVKRLTQALELVAKSKEALFGVAAAAVLVWGWVRRRRERAAAAADAVQKQKLDEFIGRTLTVEVEQMDVTEPEQLRPFLRRVTHIKQEALKELTSERVRGDQLFAIFLSQCAALSEKIQMRMIYARVTEKV